MVSKVTLRKLEIESHIIYNIYDIKYICNNNTAMVNLIFGPATFGKYISFSKVFAITD